LRVERDFFDFSFSDSISKGVFDVLKTRVDIIGVALDEHFNGAVQEITDETGQSVTSGYIVRCEAKANALDSADEDYMSCVPDHYLYHISLFCIRSKDITVFILTEDVF